MNNNITIVCRTFCFLLGSLEVTSSTSSNFLLCSSRSAIMISPYYSMKYLAKYFRVLRGKGCRSQKTMEIYPFLTSSLVAECQPQERSPLPSKWRSARQLGATTPSKTRSASFTSKIRSNYEP